MIKRHDTAASAHRATDRRAATRFRFDAGEQLTIVLPEYRWRAQVLDLSTDGLRFRVPLLFQQGDLLTMELIGPDEERSERLLARVIHLALDEDGSCLVGAAFDSPLTTVELQEFIQWCSGRLVEHRI